MGNIIGFVSEQIGGFHETFHPSKPRILSSQRIPTSIRSGYEQARPIEEPKGVGGWLEKETVWQEKFASPGFQKGEMGAIIIDTPQKEIVWSQYEAHRKEIPPGTEEYLTKLQEIERIREKEREAIPTDPTKYLTRPTADWLLMRGEGAREWITSGAGKYIYPHTGRVTPVAQVGVGATKFGASMLTEFPAAIFTGVEHILRAPKHVPEAAMIGAGLMVGGMETRAREDPYEFIGELLGMVVAPKIAARAKAYVPAPYKLTPLGGVRPFGRVRTYKLKPSPIFPEGTLMSKVTGRRIEVLKKPWTVLEHPTPKGTMQRLLKPEVFEKPGKYFHGTSLDFISEITKTGRRGITVGKGAPRISIEESSLFFGGKGRPMLTFAGGERGPGFLMWKTTPAVPKPSIVSKAFRRQQLEHKIFRTKAETRELGALRRSLKTETIHELARMKGKLYPGTKPMRGKKWKYWEEFEYVTPPGTKLFPTQTLRSKFWGKLGITKGTHYLYDPYGARTIEILGVTKKPAPFKPVKPIVDLSKPYEFIQKLTKGLTKKQLARLREIESKIKTAQKRGDMEAVYKLQREARRVGRPHYERLKGVGRGLPRERGIERIVSRERPRTVRRDERRGDETIRRIIGVPERERPPTIRREERRIPFIERIIERPPERPPRRKPPERIDRRERVPEKPFIPYVRISERYVPPKHKKKAKKRTKAQLRKARETAILNPIKTPLEVLQWRLK